MSKKVIGIIDIDKRPEVQSVISQLKDHAELRYLGDLPKTEILKALEEIDLLIIRLYPTDKEVLNHACKAKAVIKAGVGVDHVDVEKATQEGIHVVISPGNHISVAETAILLMLSVSRNLIYLNRNLDPDLNILGQELYGKKLGLVGFGRIGRHVSKVALALGMQVSVSDPFVSEEDLKAISSDIVKTELDPLLQESDYVSLHCPSNKATYHMLGKQEFKKMKSSAILVNTARGTVVDEAALCEALKSGEIAGAGLDVVEKEPLTADNPLLKLDNVIVTPHRLIQTKESLTRQTQSIIDSAVEILNGKIPSNSINQNKIDPDKDRLKN